MGKNVGIEKFYLKHAREIVQRGTLSATLGSLGVGLLLMLINWHFNQMNSVVIACGATLLIGNLYRFSTYFDKRSPDQKWFARLKWTHRAVMLSFCGIF